MKVEERLVGPSSHRKPAIVLRKQGRPIAAIEMFVSHAVDGDKASMLAELDVPWIELGSEALSDPETAWTIDQPLEPRRGSITAPLEQKSE